MRPARTISPKLRRRGRQRGAAMTEAAVVATTIVVMWGAMAIAFTNGSARLSAQWTARAGVMYHASHECKKQMPGVSAGGRETVGQFDTKSGDAQGDRATGNAPLGESFDARSTFFVAASSATKSRQLARWAATKSSSSWAVCNEGKYDGNPLGLLAYGADFFRDLLPGPIKAIF